MRKSEAAWKNVGKIKDAHSLRGEVYVLVFSKDFSWAKDLKSVQVGSQEMQIQRQKPFKDGLLMKLEGIEDRTAAEKIKGAMFSIPEELLESAEGDTIYLSEILSFSIVDSQGVALGKITGFSSNVAQDLLVVEKVSGGMAEIPFVDHFIVDIDFENEKIQMNLPEGIWDLQSL